MAAFYAELEIEGSAYPVRHCEFEFSQTTDARGRVNAKVRHNLLHLTLDVPDDDRLLAWAAAPHKPLAGHLTFFDTDQRTARETLRFAAGQCVGYREEFVSGDGGSGAYVCSLTITSDGLTMAPGGPGGAYVAAAAREYAAPVAAAVAAKETALDWMAPQQADPWQGKKQSGRAYLGSPPLKRKQLQQIKQDAQKDLGVTLKVLKEGDELHGQMRSMGMRAAFQASTKTVFLQPQATYYEASHELKHAKQCFELGVDVYSRQTRLEKEMHVYRELMKEQHLLSPSEIEHARGYINSLLVEAALPLL